MLEQCKISPLCNGFTYGEGFFTTVKVVNNSAENLAFHMKRIEESLTFFNFKGFEIDVDEIISQLNPQTDIKLKIIIFKDLERVSYIAIPGKLPPKMDFMELEYSKFIRGNDPIFSYKSLNYYNNLVNSHTLFIDHQNRILETGIGNIFIINGNKIFSPPGYLPLLNGTYRDFLLDKVYIGKYTILEQEIYKDDFNSCDGAFITNALRGVVPVTKIGNTKLNAEKAIQFRNLLK